MKIQLRTVKLEQKDFELSSGDLLYNLEHEKYFQVIKLEKGWILYNLNNHLSSNIDTQEPDGMFNPLYYSDAMQKLDDIFGEHKWEYISKNKYNITIEIYE